MRLGIIGKPQSGKTTVFNAASGQQEAVGDYSQAEHRAVIKVPDDRVDQLAALIHPKKITYAEIEFLDAPGFSGKGKESTGLEVSQEIRLMDALIVVVDSFSPDCTPEKDIEDMIDEMLLSDQVLVENNIEKKSRRAQLAGDKSAAQEIELLERCREALEKETLLIDIEFSENEDKMLRGYTFLTKKPLLFVINIAEGDIRATDQIRQKFSRCIVPHKRDVAVMCGSIEMELIAIADDERELFMHELEIKTPAVEKVIQRSYDLLGLISFLTMGEPEVRAWTIRRGTTAHRAAGAIHSDIERGFIRAEVTTFEDQIEHKTSAALKAAGRIRLEGKEYVVRDGDVILFRFNV